MSKWPKGTRNCFVIGCDSISQKNRTHRIPPPMHVKDRACSSCLPGEEALQNAEVLWLPFQIFPGGHSERMSKTDPAIIRYA